MLIYTFSRSFSMIFRYKHTTCIPPQTDVETRKCSRIRVFIAHILPYTNRIVDYVVILEDTGQRSPYSGIFYAICNTTQNINFPFKVFSSKCRIP